MNLILETRDLDVYYGTFHALSGIDLDVENEKVVSILGANGAGKSTLLNTLLGLLKPTTGHISFDGRRIDHLEPHKIVKLGLSLVPEGRQIFSSLTVLENLLIGSYCRAVRKVRQKALDGVFTLFPILKGRINQMGTDLSGGEQQMLAIGRALMSSPRMIIFDEISLGLSPVVIKELYEAVKSINQEGTAVILVEQDVKRSLKFSDFAYILQEGKVSLKGIPKDLTEDEVKRAYFGL